MKLIIFSNRDLASNFHLNLLLPKIYPYVKGIFLSDAVGKKNAAPPPYPLQEIKFFEQFLPNELLFPAFDAQDRLSEGKLLTFNELSKKFNVPLESCNDIRSDSQITYFKNLAPDLVLSVRFGKIFGNDFLKIPTFGVLNLHSGLLPNYRGVLATFRALNNDDTLHYSTLHFIDDATIDTGRIIGFSNIEVNKSKSLLWHILQIYPASIALTLQTIQQIAAGKIDEIATTKNEGGSYFSFPTETEINDFLAKGWKMCDVNEMKAFYEMYI